MVVPPLPVEIVEHIIKQSLPPLRFDTFKERYELLKTFALVDSRWRVLAQRELGRHLVVDSRCLGKMETELSNDESFAGYARSLWGNLEGPGDELTTIVELILGRSQLHHLSLSFCAFFGDMGMIQGAKFPSCTLHYSDFHFATRALPLPHIEALYLVDPYFPNGAGDWLSLLNPTTFPSLRRLQLLRTSDVLGFSFERDSAEHGGILHSLVAVAPQLTALSICEVDAPVLANAVSTQEWLLFSNLQHLTLSSASTQEDETSWLQSLQHLPPKLESLTILVLKSAKLEQLYQAIELAVRRWEGKKLRLFIKILHPKSGTSKTARDEEATEARSSLLRTAAERCIQVESSALAQAVQFRRDRFAAHEGFEDDLERGSALD
ncbi:hypothetical protein BCR35DRAFT_324305 [Leucosporidium creatinivorum]|uniref:F-box domain-containing protein n=1 Tax=Leucosporidium creatinivorum TaxID=106004 RepID=A0A1Y2FZZ9_9BASI|nr:hypothetical protein BCR35DRAFT_324305 [Leucosporidium creatinivorum]